MVAVEVVAEVWMALMVDAVVTTLICASAHRLADHDGLLATHRRRAQLQEEGINSGKLFTNNRRMSLTSVLSPMDFSNWVNCKAHLCHVIVKVFKIPLRVFFQSHLLFCDEDVLTKHIRRSPAPSLFSNVLAVTCASMVRICGVPGAPTVAALLLGLAAMAASPPDCVVTSLSMVAPPTLALLQVNQVHLRHL